MHTTQANPPPQAAADALADVIALLPPSYQLALGAVALPSIASTLYPDTQLDDIASPATRDALPSLHTSSFASSTELHTTRQSLPTQHRPEHTLIASAMPPATRDLWLRHSLPRPENNPQSLLNLTTTNLTTTENTVSDVSITTDPHTNNVTRETEPPPPASAAVKSTSLGESTSTQSRLSATQLFTSMARSPHTDEFKRIARRFYYQLTVGCRRPDCDFKLCKAAANGSISPETAAILALEMTSRYLKHSADSAATSGPRDRPTDGSSHGVPASRKSSTRAIAFCCRLPQNVPVPKISRRRASLKDLSSTLADISPRNLLNVSMATANRRSLSIHSHSSSISLHVNREASQHSNRRSIDNISQISARRNISTVIADTTVGGGTTDTNSPNVLPVQTSSAEPNVATTQQTIVSSQQQPEITTASTLHSTVTSIVRNDSVSSMQRSTTMGYNPLRPRNASPSPPRTSLRHSSQQQPQQPQSSQSSFDQGQNSNSETRQTEGQQQQQQPPRTSTTQQQTQSQGSQQQTTTPGMISVDPRASLSLRRLLASSVSAEDISAYADAGSNSSGVDSGTGCIVRENSIHRSDQETDEQQQFGLSRQKSNGSLRSVGSFRQPPQPKPFIFSIFNQEPLLSLLFDFEDDEDEADEIISVGKRSIGAGSSHLVGNDSNKVEKTSHIPDTNTSSPTSASNAVDGKVSNVPYSKSCGTTGLQIDTLQHAAPVENSVLFSASVNNYFKRVPELVATNVSGISYNAEDTEEMRTFGTSGANHRNRLSANRHIRRSRSESVLHDKEGREVLPSMDEEAVDSSNPLDQLTVDSVQKRKNQEPETSGSTWVRPALKPLDYLRRYLSAFRFVQSTIRESPSQPIPNITEHTLDKNGDKDLETSSPKSLQSPDARSPLQSPGIASSRLSGFFDSVSVKLKLTRAQSSTNLLGLSSILKLGTNDALNSNKPVIVNPSHDTKATIAQISAVDINSPTYSFAAKDGTENDLASPLSPLASPTLGSKTPVIELFQSDPAFDGNEDETHRFDEATTTSTIQNTETSGVSLLAPRIQFQGTKSVTESDSSPSDELATARNDLLERIKMVPAPHELSYVDGQILESCIATYQQSAKLTGKKDPTFLLSVIRHVFSNRKVLCQSFLLHGPRQIEKYRHRNATETGFDVDLLNHTIFPIRANGNKSECVILHHGVDILDLRRALQRLLSLEPRETFADAIRDSVEILISTLSLNANSIFNVKIAPGKINEYYKNLGDFGVSLSRQTGQLKTLDEFSADLRVFVYLFELPFIRKAAVSRDSIPGNPIEVSPFGQSPTSPIATIAAVDEEHPGSPFPEISEVLQHKLFSLFGCLKTNPRKLLEQWFLILDDGVEDAIIASSREWLSGIRSASSSAAQGEKDSATIACVKLLSVLYHVCESKFLLGIEVTPSIYTSLRDRKAMARSIVHDKTPPKFNLSDKRRMDIGTQELAVIDEQYVKEMAEKFYMNIFNNSLPLKTEFIRWIKIVHEEEARQAASSEYKQKMREYKKKLAAYMQKKEAYDNWRKSHPQKTVTSTSSKHVGTSEQSIHASAVISPENTNDKNVSVVLSTPDSAEPPVPPTASESEMDVSKSKSTDSIAGRIQGGLKQLPLVRKAFGTNTTSPVPTSSTPNVVTGVSSTGSGTSSSPKSPAQSPSPTKSNNIFRSLFSRTRTPTDSKSANASRVSLQSPQESQKSNVATSSSPHLEFLSQDPSSPSKSIPRALTKRRAAPPPPPFAPPHPGIEPTIPQMPAILNQSSVTQEFSFLNFPFLLPPLVKMAVVHRDAILQMTVGYENAFVNQSLVLHAQRFVGTSSTTGNNSNNVDGDQRNAGSPNALPTNPTPTPALSATNTSVATETQPIETEGTVASDDVFIEDYINNAESIVTWAVDKFENALKKIGVTNPFLVLEIRRDHMVEDVMDQLSILADRKGELKKPMKVRFVNEQGHDQGGVQKEFFQVLIDKLIDPDFGMFTYNSDTRTSHVDGFSLEPISRFELVGYILGLALYNGIIVGVKFPSYFYKIMLDDDLLLSDLQEAFPVLGRGLQQLLDWDESNGNVDDIFMRTFEISYEVHGTVKHVPLVQRGADILVTNETRAQYVRLYIDHLLYKGREKQMEAIKRGFIKVIGSTVKRLCRYWELEWLLCGNEMQSTNFRELEQGCGYDDGYTRETPVIDWFWSIVHNEMDLKVKKRLLNFVTASDRVPLGGLSKLNFIIQRNGPDSDRLPTALTCFGRLLLPEYSSKDKLRKYLLIAIKECKGFGLI